jgi:RNA polymerase sigma-70 factor (ECF subfamily)
MNLLLAFAAHAPVPYPVYEAPIGLWQWLRLLFSKTRDAEALSGDATDEALMAAYQVGDQRAFRRLFDRFAPRIHGAALRRGLSAADANDVVQQTFVHVHQGRKEFKAGAPVRPWVYTIAFNVMRDLGRRFSSQKRLKERVISAAKVSDQVAPSTSAEQRSILQSALDLLSPAQREVLVLHYFEEMSFGDIARTVGSREGAVRGRAHRGYEKLRAILTGGNRKRGAS